MKKENAIPQRTQRIRRGRDGGATIGAQRQLNRAMGQFIARFARGGLFASLRNLSVLCVKAFYF
jgi:hypothetical protein